MANSSGDDRGRDFSANRSMDEPVPGTTGRPMNRRRSDDEIDARESTDTENFGVVSGGKRSPKVLQKIRKTRRAA
jgi:hypothetical protein